MFKFFLEKKYKEWAGEWLKQKEPFVKPSSFAKYKFDVESRLVPKFGEFRLSAITEKSVQEWLSELAQERRPNGKRYTLTTLKGWVLTLIVSLNDAAAQKLCPAPSFKLKYPKTASRVKIEYYSKEEQKAIVESFWQDKALWRAHKLSSPTFRATVGVLLSLYTGMRIGEVCGVKWQDVNLEELNINVSRTVYRIYKSDCLGGVNVGAPKSATSARVIPISKPLLNILNLAQDRKPEHYLLTNKAKPMEPLTLRLHYEKFLERHNIAPRKFHALRHTFATRCIEAGIDPKTVSTVLGHASPLITLSIYCHPAENLRRKCVETFADI